MRGEVELFGLREMRDVARVNRQRGPDRHRVDPLDRLFERARDVGIGFLVEADMRVADLQEQRHARGRRGIAARGGARQLDRREYPRRPARTRVPAPPNARHLSAPRRDRSKRGSDGMVSSRLNSRGRPPAHPAGLSTGFNEETARRFVLFPDCTTVRCIPSNRSRSVRARSMFRIQFGQRLPDCSQNSYQCNDTRTLPPHRAARPPQVSG